MKRTFAIILFALFTIAAVAQSNYQEVVYLKNGSIIRGVIIEQVPNKSIKIETPDRSVFVYQMDEIDKITKEKAARKSNSSVSLLRSGSVDKDAAKISFGVKGGLNLSKLHAKDDEDNYSADYKLKPGFHIGVTAEMPITETIAFETGLLLSTKGFKMNESEAQVGGLSEFNATVNLLYLDLPLTAKTYFTVGGTRLFGVFGPTIGYGLSGKSKFEATINGEVQSDKSDVNWGSGDNDDFKHFDFGLTAGAGIEISAIQIGLNYNLGLANMINYSENGTNINNRVIALSVGYKFAGK